MNELMYEKTGKRHNGLEISTNHIITNIIIEFILKKYTIIIEFVLKKKERIS